MTPLLVPLHIAPDAEGFPAARVRAAERLLARVRVRVDLQARRAREGLVARLADVALLRLRVGRVRGGPDVVVVLPGVGGGEEGRGGREAGGEGPLVAGRVAGGLLVGGVEGARGGEGAGRGGVGARGCVGGGAEGGGLRVGGDGGAFVEVGDEGALLVGFDVVEGGADEEGLA